MFIALVIKSQFSVVSTVAKKRKFTVVITVVEKGQVRVVITVVKKSQLIPLTITSCCLSCRLSMSRPVPYSGSSLT